jgi:hypothetical protein
MRCPPCPSDFNKHYHLCFGKWKYATGVYTGNWRNNLPSGLGVWSKWNGTRAGIWARGKLLQSLTVAETNERLNNNNRAHAPQTTPEKRTAAAPKPAPLPTFWDTLSREDIRSIQTALNLVGFNAGAADGIAGLRTKRAFEAYRQSEV